MDAVLLGLLAGVLFGAMTVAVRAGLLRGGDPALGQRRDQRRRRSSSSRASRCRPSSPTEWISSQLWPFAAVGLVVPGLSQLLFILAVRHAGPSRAAILVGTAPLGSVLLAMALLDEPLRPALLVGTALIVAGGAALALDPGRPAGFRALGVVLALTCAALFAGRDNAVRWIARDDDVAAAPGDRRDASGGDAGHGRLRRRRRGGTSRRRRSRARRRGPSSRPGVLLAFAYGALVTGFDRGDVGIVAPLNATQSLWGVAFAALVYGQREAIGRRTVLASVLVVLGGALIGAFR